ncbi:MAG: hypothetical protein K0R54_1210 [Clostridiaceae bacterium]|nr:hypothetical protein [Clostridiaceae bacterium]
MGSFIKDLIKDLLYCLKLSVGIFFIPFIIGMIVGVILHGLNIKEVLAWGSRIVQWASAFGLGIAGIAFIKPKYMRPLNYQDVWETYFRKFNLAHVIFFISIFTAIYSYIIQIYFT